MKILVRCPACGRWVLLGFPHRVCAAGIDSTIVSEGYSVRLDRLLSTAKLARISVLLETARRFLIDSCCRPGSEARTRFRNRKRRSSLNSSRGYSASNGASMPVAILGALAQPVGSRPHCLLAASVFYQGPNRESCMVISRAVSSSSNVFTAGDVSPSPGTTTAHSKFSRNSWEMIRHRSSGGGVIAPI